eukprot:scpid99604/ scgid0205/ DNA topoisomerase 2-binding protein 1-B; DNA topoisomerase II-binding protein 1-B; Xmus101
MIGLLEIGSSKKMSDPQAQQAARNRRARQPTSRRFMLTFFSSDERQELTTKIRSLDGVVIEDSTFDSSTTHVIARLPNRNEKFLSACASGKWVLSPAYIKESCRHGRWLEEEPYEWTVERSRRSCDVSRPGEWVIMLLMVCITSSQKADQASACGSPQRRRGRQAHCRKCQLAPSDDRLLCGVQIFVM